ncbi:MAG TPA: excisionase family DNA-binding protein, partial [Candidatus Limnocylindria bacterium]|nr:excisionase family DNA-binding protein [Candidatus Limnocylindria bacterium]
MPETAALLGIGETLTYELIHSRQIPAIRLGRLLRIPRAQLVANLSGASSPGPLKGPQPEAGDDVAPVERAGAPQALETRTPRAVPAFRRPVGGRRGFRAQGKRASF